VNGSAAMVLRCVVAQRYHPTTAEIDVGLTKLAKLRASPTQTGSTHFMLHSHFVNDDVEELYWVGVKLWFKLWCCRQEP